MDISSITPTTREVVITSPANAEPIGLTIRLRPMTSPEVLRVKRDHTNSVLKNRGKHTAEKIEANTLDTLVAATDGWSWIGDANFRGEKPEATPENIRRVYKDVPWIRDQIDAALGDEAAFFRGADE